MEQEMTVQEATDNYYTAMAAYFAAPEDETLASTFRQIICRLEAEKARRKKNDIRLPSRFCD